MKRIDMLKTMGFATLAIGTGIGLVSCENKTEQAVVPPVKEKEKSEIEKLIVNRQENKFADPNNPTDFELKHTPDITFGGLDKNNFAQIYITIGSNGIIHPTEQNHWIDFIKVFVNNKLIQNIEFTNGVIRGYNSCFAKLNKGDVVKVIAGCNIHGIWQNEVEYK